MVTTRTLVTLARWAVLLLMVQLFSVRVDCFTPKNTVPARWFSRVEQSQQSRRMAVAKTGGKVMSTAEEFASKIHQPERPVLVFFTAAWCGPCRLSVPVVKEVMKEFADRMDIIEVCTDDLPEVAADANVVSIPTIQMYNGGEVMDTIVGCVAKSVLSSSVDKVLEDIAQRVGEK